jgi:endoglucanase
MNTFRLPFRWERLQPSQNGALDAAELGRMNGFVNYATSKGAYVILDPHNFARYYPNPAGSQSTTNGLIGTSGVPISSFADFWTRVAGQYKNNDRVLFGLMNEPCNMSTETWVGAANAAIAGIRGAGATNLVLVPGNGWSGAHSWAQNWYGTANAVAMLNIVDPGNNYAYEVHQYFDQDSSGTSSTIYNNDPNLGVSRLTGFTDWLRANNRRGFLGEFAVANSTIGAGVGDELLGAMFNHIESNGDVWQGWTYWSGGPWWGEYMFTSEPTNLGLPSQADRPVMGVLQAHVVPEPSIAALLAAGGCGWLVFRRRIAAHRKNRSSPETEPGATR